MVSGKETSVYPFLQGGGEMGELTREFDWASTSVGEPSQWPFSLRTTVSNLLRSRFPMFLWWGQDMIQFYNDAYRPSLGQEGKHPRALGAKGQETWPEIWEHISPLHEHVQSTGEPTWLENQLIPIFRNGKIEDVYWTFSYSSVLDDDGKHGGILVTCTETTEAIKHFQQLEQSKEIYQNLVHDTITAMVVLMGPEMKVEIVNEAYGRLINASPDDLLGKPLFEVIPEFRNLYQPLLEKVYQTGERIVLEEVAHSIVTNGEVKEIFLHVLYQPYRDAKGNILGVMANLQDVTDQVTAKKKLEESELFARGLFDNSPAAMLIYTGPNMVFKDVNRKMLEILGQDDSILGRSILDVMPTLKESPLHEHCCKVWATGQPHREVARRLELLKNGQSYWGYFDYTYEPLRDATGNIYCIICTTIEVTDRVLAQQADKEKAAALRNAVELAELGTWTMSVKTGIMIFSERHAELWGFDTLETTAEDAISRIVKEDQERVSSAFYNALKPGSDGRYEAEFMVANAKTDEVIIARALGQVYYDGEGRPITIAGTTQDVTVQRKTQEALEVEVRERTKELSEAIESLNLSNAELKRSNNYLEEFTYAASHDLKEPVRKIRFFTSRITNELASKVNEEELRFLQRIESASERMARLIDDLLRYSHITHKPHKTEPVDLGETINRVLEDLELEIEKTSSTINVGNMPVVQGYPRQLQQLFQNLIGNAIKYSKSDVPSQVQIVASQVIENEREYYLFEVTDNGIGFEPQFGEQIFQIFTRLHGKDYSGTGIGLSMVRKIAENHKGFVRVESQKDIGSNFKVYLPAD